MLRSLLERVLAFWPGYPPDWERRRMVVFERAHGRCERCGIPAGTIRLVADYWRVCGAHVHHVVPIRRGGRHHLENLQLLCPRCHALAHPGNTRLVRYCAPPFHERRSTTMRKNDRHEGHSF